MLKNIRGAIVLRDGEIVHEQYAAPYRPDDRRALYSLTKSFSSAALGIAEAEGLMHRDDKIFDLLGEPAPGPHAREMRIRHLLTMTGGYESEDISYINSPGWLKACAAVEPECAPGERFVYDNRPPYFLSRAIERKTGLTLSQYLGKKLFAPLGITDFSWTTDPDGHNPGGFGLNMRLRDVARFGQMLLNGGEGIVPEGYIREATRAQVLLPEGIRPNHRWCAGYGYWFWIANEPGTFVGSGSFGQLLVVRPARREVVAVNAACTAPNVVCEACLSGEIGTSDVLPPEGEGRVLRPRRYVFSPNPLGIRAVTVEATGKETRIAVESGERTMGFCAGARGFLENRLDVEEWGAGYPCFGDFFRSARAAGAWKGDAFHGRIVQTETPYVDEVRMMMKDGSVSIRIDRAPSIERLRPAFVELKGTEA